MGDATRSIVDACRKGAVWGDVARRVALWEGCGEERNSMGEMWSEVDEYGADAAKSVTVWEG